ncbi:flagellar hook-associated protein FlgL [Rummeliibacillus sp. NPDC094406]|uniref:flagellar hook-associated protein FlgL n=1 Tax=Rummeliibacillus sp. NPDC094406 TaxID=3364511 RepID=UPI00381C1534
MRVTQSMLSNNLLRNLNTSNSKMGKLQEQLSSGSKLTRPSDDPVASVKGMNHRTTLAKNDQYTRNMGEVNSWLDASDESLGQVGSALSRVQELVSQAANGTNTADDREKILKEIEQIRAQIRDVANTKIGDNYIFSGTMTTTPLYDKSGFIGGTVEGTTTIITPPSTTTGAIKFPVNSVDLTTGTAKDADGNDVQFTTGTDANGNTILLTSSSAGAPQFTLDENGYAVIKSQSGFSSNVPIELYSGITLDVNSEGYELFQKIDNMMAKVEDKLKSGDDVKELVGDLLGGTGSSKDKSGATIQGAIGLVLEARATVGAKQNRADMMADRLSSQKISVTKQMSDNEDVDYEEAITNLITEESIHRAALSVGGRIIQPTLVDFIH